MRSLVHVVLLSCLMGACGAGPAKMTGAEPDSAVVSSSDGTQEPSSDAKGAIGFCDHFNPEKNAYFGDLHVHTRHSFDATIFNEVGRYMRGAAEAYAFARGQPAVLPDDAGANATRTLPAIRPLDFAAVTDHSEYLGETHLCTTPGAAGYESRTCQVYRQRDNAGFVLFGQKLTDLSPERFAFCGPQGGTCTTPGNRVWQEIQRAADEAQDRTRACRFTTFNAYEWTATTAGAKLHRNILFRNATVPAQPISYFEAPTAQAMWRQLAAACMDAGTGCDALAIPHNSNGSNGQMFSVEGLTADLARMRHRMEPLVEIYQHKGSSECDPASSDPRCRFEVVGTSSAPEPGSYVRQALVRGLAVEDGLGVNPFKLGIIASTDTHNASPGAVEEQGYQGHTGVRDDDPQDRLGLTDSGFSPGGLAGVWAEENTRASIYAALARRETWGTSGPRIRVRFFGGWGLPSGLCDSPQAIALATRDGVPMGADLPAPPAGGAGPRFLIWAVADPGTADQAGAPLQKLQIIKGWVAADGPRERVVDVLDRTGTNLCTVWSDPEWSPQQRAVYYARVLQVPTPRWSAFDCQSLPPASRPRACRDERDRTIEERAWTSPIWYQPR